MSTPTRIIFIHGNGGATADLYWFPSAAAELRTHGLEVITETFPDNELARADEWLPHIQKLGANHQTILVGHSSGAVAALRYAETNRLHGLALIGVSHTDLDDADEKASGYFDKPWQWDKIISNVDFVEVFASADDPYIPIEEPRFVAKMTDANYHEFSDRGHFMIPELPELVPALLKHISLESQS